MRRRRRRAGGQWLPNQGSLLNALGTGDHGEIGDQNSFLTIFNSSVSVAPNGSFTTEAPLTPADVTDIETGAPANQIAVYQARNLAESQGFGYKLERIVGTLKVLTAPTASQNDLTPSVVMVGAALMVNQVDPENPETPLRGGERGDPLSLETIQDPWIWRRSWLLCPGNAGGDTQPSSPAGSDNFSGFSGALQPTNTVFTGLYDTSTVDTKTKRVVKNDERLFLHIAARCVGFNPTVDPGNVKIQLGVVFDYRIYAKPFTNKSGNRRNASR